MTDLLPPLASDDFGDDEFDWARYAFDSSASEGGAAESESRSASPLLPRRRRRRRWLRVVTWLVKAWVVFELFVLLLNFVTPPRTMFMLTDPHPEIPLAYEYVDLDHISRWLPAAVILHEDAEFGTRIMPFDFDHFGDRVLDYFHGKPDTSGSTIPQQLAKNIFLPRWGSWFRKAMEVPLSASLNFLVSDQRMLELYLNEAQFAQNLYGVCAATWYYWNSAPWDITREQAILLAGLLPAGDYARRGPDGGIDVSNPDSSATQTVWHAAEVLPDRFAEWGGDWSKILKAVGITDSAADHAGERGEGDSCSQMPDSVAKRISWEADNRAELSAVSAPGGSGSLTRGW